MKKHLSSLVFGVLGLVAGFVVCYITVVLPKRDSTTMATPVVFAYTPDLSQRLVEGPPYMIEPTLPPKVVGRIPPSR